MNKTDVLPPEYSPDASLKGVAVSIPMIPFFGLEIVDSEASPVIHTLLDGTRRRVAFLNAHCANVMERDKAYAAALGTADMVLPDGIGIALGVRMIGHRLTANLNGTDFTPRLLERAAELGHSVFLYGGAAGVAKAAAERLCRDISGLRIAGTRDGFEGARDEDGVLQQINESGADIVLVALGVPGQDVWLARNADRLAPRLCVGVGALFDFLAGRIARAPVIVRKARLEWVWRMALEPRRMARRYLIGNVTFMIRAMRHAVHVARHGAVPKRES